MATLQKKKRADNESADRKAKTTATAEAWQQGLFECCVDGCCPCLGAFLCPCIVYGNNREKAGDGGCCTYCLEFLVCCPCCCGYCIHAPFRSRIREDFNLREECCADGCVVLFCGTCANIQESAELDFRKQPPVQVPPQEQEME